MFACTLNMRRTTDSSTVMQIICGLKNLILSYPSTKINGLGQQCPHSKWNDWLEFFKRRLNCHFVICLLTYIVSCGGHFVICHLTFNLHHLLWRSFVICLLTYIISCGGHFVICHLSINLHHLLWRPFCLLRFWIGFDFQLACDDFQSVDLSAKSVKQRIMGWTIMFNVPCSMSF